VQTVARKFLSPILTTAPSLIHWQLAVNFELVKDFSSLKVALAPVAGKTEKIFAFLVANRPKCLR
jgi:hypothetical protein